MKKKYRFLFFLIGLAGIAVLAFSTDPDALDWKSLFTPQLPLLVAALLLVWAMIYAMHTEVYRLILGERAAEIKRYELYRICVSGFALNSVTPAGLVGGEPYRILELRRFVDTEKATEATLTFTMIYIVGHIMLWLTGILIYILYGCPDSAAVTVILLVAAAVFTAAVCVFFSFRKRGFIMPVLGFFMKVPLLKKAASKAAGSYGEVLEDIDSGFVEFRSVPKRFRTAVALEYLSRLFEGIEYFLIFRYLGTGINLFGGILILSMASLIGNLLFMVPMQAGTREGGLAIAIGWLGIEPAMGLMGGLIYRMRDLLCIITGILLILLGKGPRKQEKTTDKEKESL